jgi:hypothetical protein
VGVTPLRPDPISHFLGFDITLGSSFGWKRSERQPQEHRDSQPSVPLVAFENAAGHLAP